MFRKPMLSGPFILNPMAPRVWSPVGGSTLMTSAPMSASSMQAKGPAMTWLTSRTRMPFSGRLFAVFISAVRANVGGTYHLAPFFVFYGHEGRKVIHRAAAVLDAVAVEALDHVGHEQHLVDVRIDGHRQFLGHVGGPHDAVPAGRIEALEAPLVHGRHIGEA